MLLTGHTGFKGSWLLLILDHLGAEVTGFSLPPPSSPSMFEILNLRDFCEHHVGDVRDLPALQEIARSVRPEIVFHMAAQPLVRAAYTSPIETYSTNVMGTANLLEACREISQIQAIINVTTDKCYENEGVSSEFVESDRLGGFDPYSSSKACSELVTSAYRNSFFAGTDVGVASARAGNVIGGGDFAEDRLVPDAIRAFICGNSLKVRNKLSTRPWQHVLEPLTGYLQLAERLSTDRTCAEAWNFGPRADDVASVEQVVNGLVNNWGQPACWHQDEGVHPHEATSLTLSSKKSCERLGWVPQLELDQALDLTIEWYRTWQLNGDLLELSKLQISNFLTVPSDSTIKRSPE